MTRLAVVFATVGRPDVVRQSVDHLVGQSRQPDLVVVSSVSPADTKGVEHSRLRPEIIYGAKGLCAQRNNALRHVAGRADIVLFFDDDFVPAATYVAETIALFEQRPDLAGATGRVIADGIKTPGYSFPEALSFIAEDRPAAEPRVRPCVALYGCNMAIRLSLADGLSFDERMPLYGWLEDIDFTYRLRARGPLVNNDRMAGVHLGTKGGRTSGARFGYSQIANPIHMLRKGSIPKFHAFEMMAKNLASNLVYSIRPEPYVDRAGRLRGNLHAITDLFMGRLDPERILQMDGAQRTDPLAQLRGRSR